MENVSKCLWVTSLLSRRSTEQTKSPLSIPDEPCSSSWTAGKSQPSKLHVSWPEVLCSPPRRPMSTQTQARGRWCFKTLFFLTPVDMKRSSIPGQYCSVEERYFLKALMGQSKSPFLSPSTESSKDGIVNSSKRGSGTKGFWVLAMKLGRKEKVQDLQPREWRTRDKRLCNSVTLLADMRASKKVVFQVRCLSEASLRSSKRGRDKHRRTRQRFQSGGLTSRRGQDIPEKPCGRESVTTSSHAKMENEGTFLPYLWIWWSESPRNNTLLDSVNQHSEILSLIDQLEDWFLPIINNP